MIQHHLVCLLFSLAACAQNPPTGLVSVGAGSYTTRLPAGAKEPATPPYVTAGRTRPTPTNDWWSSLVFSRFSNQMFPHPLGIQAHDTGLRLYYPGMGYTANAGGIFTAILRPPDDLIIGHSAQATFTEARVPMSSTTLPLNREGSPSPMVRSSPQEALVS